MHPLPHAKMYPYIGPQSYQGYTAVVKTAVSLPDALYQEAEETARALGIPRSRLFAQAVADYLRRHRRATITERLNKVYERQDDPDAAEVPTDASIDSLEEVETGIEMVMGTG